MMVDVMDDVLAAALADGQRQSAKPQPGPQVIGRRPAHDLVAEGIERHGGNREAGLNSGEYDGRDSGIRHTSGERLRVATKAGQSHPGALPARRLHWIGRLHLLTGIGAYITAPLWLPFLLAGIVNALFPSWPVVDPVRAMFVATMAMLLPPKLLAGVVAISDRAARRGSGGVLLESSIYRLLARW